MRNLKLRLLIFPLQGLIVNAQLHSVIVTIRDMGIILMRPNITSSRTDNISMESFNHGRFDDVIKLISGVPFRVTTI